MYKIYREFKCLDSLENDQISGFRCDKMLNFNPIDKNRKQNKQGFVY